MFWFFSGYFTQLLLKPGPDPVFFSKWTGTGTVGGPVGFFVIARKNSRKCNFFLLLHMKNNVGTGFPALEPKNKKETISNESSN